MFGRKKTLKPRAMIAFFGQCLKPPKRAFTLIFFPFVLSRKWYKGGVLCLREKINISKNQTLVVIAIFILKILFLLRSLSDEFQLSSSFNMAGSCFLKSLGVTLISRPLLSGFLIS